MKGLLIKDIRLLLRQKKLLLMIALLMLFLAQNGLEFILGYFICACFLLGDTTIGYDTADKNLAYLMTLPASRKTYVLEKCLLTLLPGIGATVFAIVIRLGMAWIQKQPVVLAEVIFGFMIIFFVSSLLVAVLLPIELLDTEKRKIIVNLVASAFGVVWIMLMRDEEALQKISGYAMKIVEKVSMTGAYVGALGIWTVVMASSIVCSMVIMRRKEF